MKHLIVLSVAIAALIALPPRTFSSAGPERRFDGGEASIDLLVNNFMRALRDNDEHALHRLRVTEAEYRDIIVPGSVKPGESLRNGVRKDTGDFFWSMLNQKSEDYARAFLKGFGGRDLKCAELTFTSGTREYALYKSHGNVRMVLEDQNGRREELQTGAIAEVDGRYKFIGFNSK